MDLHRTVYLPVDQGTEYWIVKGQQVWSTVLGIEALLRSKPPHGAVAWRRVVQSGTDKEQFTPVYAYIGQGWLYLGGKHNVCTEIG